MTAHTSADVVAIIRAAEHATTTGDEAPLTAALNALDGLDVIPTFAALVVIVQGAYRAGAAGQSWADFLAELGD